MLSLLALRRAFERVSRFFARRVDGAAATRQNARFSVEVPACAQP